MTMKSVIFMLMVIGMLATLIAPIEFYRYHKKDKENDKGASE